MKKILIAGGAGYVGGHLTDLLAKNKKYQVTVLDNLLYEKSYLKDVNFIFEDVLNSLSFSFDRNDIFSLLIISGRQLFDIHSQM